MSQLSICLIIFVLTVIGYCTSFFDLATTAIISLVALSVTGCLTPNAALSYFANSNVIMIGGMCIVAAGFNKTKFCMLIANKIAAVSKGSMTRLLAGYICIGIILSQFIQSPVVVFGIVAPMLLASGESAGYSPSKLMFPLGVATVVTCCTLPVGAGATVAAELNGYIESYGYTAFKVGMTDAALARFPLMIIAALYLIFVAPKLAPEKPVVPTRIAVAKDAKKSALKEWQEWAGLIIFFGDALALMFSAKVGLQIWQITVIGALLMVMCGILNSKEAIAAIPANMLFLIIGALAMSGALSATGAGKLIGDTIAAISASMGNNSYLLGLIFFIIPFLMTQVMQNRGVMMIFHPIAIATCAAMGANPVGLMILIQAACLSAFMTPMATAAIPYIMEYGGYDQVSMIKQSLPLCLVCCVVSVGWIMTMFPIF